MNYLVIAIQDTEKTIVVSGKCRIVQSRISTGYKHLRTGNSLQDRKCQIGGPDLRRVVQCHIKSESREEFLITLRVAFYTVYHTAGDMELTNVDSIEIRK